MFHYEKKLQFPVKIATPNPKLAAFIISQYGGPDGEMGASMRYLSQRYACPYREVSAVLTDIGVSVTLLYINKFHICNLCYIVLFFPRRSNCQSGRKRHSF